MKLVIAYIRYDAFETIRQALVDAGLPSVTVTEVKGTGRQRGLTEQYRGATSTSYLRPKLRIEMGVPDASVQTVVDTILHHARTGHVGDGKIFVRPLDDVVRIRTGEVGDATLQPHEAPTAPAID